MEFKLNKSTVLVMILSAIGGFAINYWSSKLANDRLLEELKAEIATINQQQIHARGIDATVLEKRKIEVQAQIDILSGNKK